jgi:hypothetical protein
LELYRNGVIAITLESRVRLKVLTTEPVRYSHFIFFRTQDANTVHSYHRSSMKMIIDSRVSIDKTLRPSWQDTFYKYELRSRTSKIRCCNSTRIALRIVYSRISSDFSTSKDYQLQNDFPSQYCLPVISTLLLILST